jgi:hypothetical protein
VAAQDWATWHHVICRTHAMCQSPIHPHLPCVCSVTFHCIFHVFHVSYGRVTCHPCSGDMCHSLTHSHVLSQSTSSPHQHANEPCHINCMTVWPVQSVATWHCTDCTVINFLSVWQNEQIAIYGAYDVRLSPFKLRWVRIDEAYAHVHFEAILSTLIFRPSRTHFGPEIQFWITCAISISIFNL